MSDFIGCVNEAWVNDMGDGESYSGIERRVHVCPFSDQDTERIRRLALMLNDEGIDNLQALIQLGAQYRKWQAAGQYVIVVTIVGGLLSALWVGIKSIVERGN